MLCDSISRLLGSLVSLNSGGVIDILKEIEVCTRLDIAERMLSSYSK